jgi:hypothetical protein
MIYKALQALVSWHNASLPQHKQLHTACDWNRHST